MSTPTRGYKGPSTTARGKTKKILVLQTTSENPTTNADCNVFTWQPQALAGFSEDANTREGGETFPGD